MLARELNGAADMMRREIHLREDGIINSGSIGLRTLEDDFLGNEAFACWENEIARPVLIAADDFGSEPSNAFLRQIIEDIPDETSVINDRAWRTVGPQQLTDADRRQYQDLTFCSGHYFIPERFAGGRYCGKGPVYASQHGGSTPSRYARLHSEPAEAIRLVPEHRNGNTARPMALRPPLEARRAGISNNIGTLGRIDVFSKFRAGKRVLQVGFGAGATVVSEPSPHQALAQARARFADIRDDYDLVLAHVADAAGQ